METVLTLETFSLKRNAAIARISYAMFDIENGEIFLEKHLNVDANLIDIQLFDIDAETINWIETLDKDVQETFFSNSQPLFNVLNEINGDGIWNTNVWCNTSFDAPILLNAYDTLNFKGPTMYKFKDISTLCYISNLPMMKKTHNGIKDIPMMVNLISSSYNKIKYGEY